MINTNLFHTWLYFDFFDATLKGLKMLNLNILDIFGGD